MKLNDTNEETEISQSTRMTNTNEEKEESKEEQHTYYYTRQLTTLNNNHEAEYSYPLYSRLKTHPLSFISTNEQRDFETI